MADTAERLWRDDGFLPFRHCPYRLPDRSNGSPCSSSPSKLVAPLGKSDGLKACDLAAAFGARVEIRQCDANGRYHYVQDGRADRARDENFQGYGATTTDPSGGYEFLTIRPVLYPGRTPHIHFAVSDRGFERFITQMYVAGEPGNGSDPVLMGVRDPAARARLIVALRPLRDTSIDILSGEFDIVLG